MGIIIMIRPLFEKFSRVLFRQGFNNNKYLAFNIIDEYVNTKIADLGFIGKLISSIESAQYINRHMSQSKTFDSPYDLLTYSIESVSIDGLFLEFGVYNGNSINQIAKIVNDEVHGFDSFNGLPETWRSEFEVGSFDKKGEPPMVLDNVILHQGLFHETLPSFASINKDKSIAFLHIDCDIYSSTKVIFDLLGHMIKPNTIIVFDEYFNYPSWQKHEHKAFMEFTDSRKISYQYIAYNKMHQQVAVKI
jgi:hypothetical protein